ncbi:MAG: GTP-binding protein [Candidatus Heimdallarchaeota archaeon]|nr:GTP-binding protein [Candidatus Heimdallarchaeota archaeon]
MSNSIETRKIVVLGNPGVGKTSIIQRYVHDQFAESYAATLGFNIYTRYIAIDEKQVGLSIWDVGGQEAFKKFAFRYLLEADAAIFVTDVTKVDSIESLAIWNEKISEVVNRKIPKIVLFNKIDLDYDMDEISEKIAHNRIRKEFNGIVFASAKTGKNIIDIFTMIANMLSGWNEEFGIPIKQKVLFNGAFEEEKLPVLFFTNKDCLWCPAILNNLTSIGSEYPINLRVINTDLETELAEDYGILSLPTTIIGTKTIVGDSDKSFFKAIINDEYLKLISK